MVQISERKLTDIRPYERNPRKNDSAVKYVANSIREFGFKVPIVIDANGVIVAGHTRYKAAKQLGMKTVPCVVADDLNDEQIAAFRLADNKTAELAEWDADLLTVELDDIAEIDMSDFGFYKSDDWFDRKVIEGKDTEGQDDDYKDFVEKFEPKKTTDDCYTPPLVYDAVLSFACEEYGIDPKKTVRPFVPNGDYQKFDYSGGAVVVDNPPFSIISEIVRFYVDNGVRFFLFAPALTTFSDAVIASATALPCGVTITYENGAKVATSFLTNLDDADTAVRLIPRLFQVVKKADDDSRSEQSSPQRKYDYPSEVVTAALCNRYCKYGVEWKIKRADAVRIAALDAQKEAGDAIFGGGLLLSERAAAERAAAERAAAERAAAERWQLSDREREIVKSLGGGMRESGIVETKN